MFTLSPPRLALVDLLAEYLYSVFCLGRSPDDLLFEYFDSLLWHSVTWLAMFTPSPPRLALVDLLAEYLYTHPAVGSSQVLCPAGEQCSVNLIGVSLALSTPKINRITSIRLFDAS
jgi:hypothetical protein